MQRLCATVHVHKTEVAWPQHGQAGWAGFGSLEWRLGQCSPLDQRHTHTAGIAPCHPPASVSSATCRHSLSVQSSRFAARALGQMSVSRYQGNGRVYARRLPALRQFLCFLPVLGRWQGPLHAVPIKRHSLTFCVCAPKLRSLHFTHPVHIASRYFQ